MRSIKRACENGYFSGASCRTALRNRSGAAAIEFAIVGPVFVLMLLGIVSYGGYFWLAHSVQQLANDGARSAVAGLSATERQQLAQATITSEVTSYASLNASLMTVTESEQSQAITVTVNYNAADSGFWIASIVPMPSTTIERSATVKLGGY
jgi:Flp pilus assembly protein TadG